MATEVRSIKMPGGSIARIKMPAEWGATEIRQEMVNRGMLDAAEGDDRDAFEADDLPPFVDPPKAEPKEEPQSSPIADQLLRQAGLTTRALGKAATMTPALIGDAANALVSMVPGVDIQPVSASVDQALDALGLPVPETRTEKAVMLMNEVIGSTGAGIKAVAKTFTGPIAKQLTERTGVQLGASTAAGGGILGAQEAELGLPGTMGVALLSTFAGAGATSQSHKMWGRWVDGRMRVNKPITMDEVREVADEAGVPVQDSNLLKLTEELNELRLQAKIADKVAAKQHQLAPKVGDTLEQQRHKRHERGKLGAAATVEQRRAKAALLRKDIEKAEQAVLKEQAREHVKDPAVAVPEKTSNRIEKNTGVAVASAAARAPRPTGRPTVTPTPTPTTPKLVFKPDADVPKDSSGRLLRRDRFGNDLISIIEKIAPRMAIEVRRTTMQGRTRASASAKAAAKFFDDPRVKKLSKADKEELSLTMKNSHDPAMKARRDALLNRIGMRQIFQREIDSQLKGAGRVLTEQGSKGIIKDFWPHVVRNVPALRKAFNRENPQGGFSQQLADAERESMRTRGHGLNPNEVAGIIGKLVLGRNTKIAKERRIMDITPEHMKHYESTKDEFLDYMQRFHQEQAIRDFFKNTLRQEMPPGQQRVNENNLANLMAHSISTRDGLSTGSAAELAELLNIHFGVARMGMSKGRTAAKNIGLAGTLGSLTSTLTQIVDVAPVMNRFGLRNTLMAMSPGARRGLKDVNVYNVGVRELNKEMSTHRGTAGLLNNVLKATGFNGIDKVFSGVGLRAAYLKWTRLANKSRHQAKRELDDLFGENTTQLVADLQAGRLTDDVKTLMLHETGKVRPHAREDMPVGWAKDPNGRWRYSLLSWTLKQLNAQRNDAMKDWRTGNRARATKRLGSLAIAMGIMGGSVNSIKDFISGREIDPVDNIVTGVFSMGMAGKYLNDALASNAPERALGAIVPAYGIIAQAGQSVYQTATNFDPTRLANVSPAVHNWISLANGNLTGLVVDGISMAGKTLVGNDAPTSSSNPLLSSQVTERPEPVQAKLSSFDQQTTPLVDQIAKGEGTDDARAQAEGFASGYDVPYGYGKHAMPEKPLTEMTIAEVMDFQRKQIGATKGLIPRTKRGTGAVGRYQFTQGTLRELIQLEGIDLKDKFGPEIQDRLMKRKLNMRGYDKFRAGKISADTLLDNLAQEWASVAGKDGKSAHGQAVGTKREHLKQLLQ